MPDETLHSPMGGMVEAMIPAPGTAQQIYNLRRDPEGFWRDVPGSVPITNVGGGTGAVMSIGWFNPRPGLRWLVYEVATTPSLSTIQYVDFRTTAPVTIMTRKRISSQDRGSLFLENAGWLYVFSSVDAPRRWNGLWDSPVGFTGPAPTPVVSGYDQGFTSPDRGGAVMTGPVLANVSHQRGVGEFPNSDAYWRYGYVITQVNELGQESPPSDMQFASGLNDHLASIGRRMVRIKVPPMPAHVRGVRIYRTRNLIQGTNPAYLTTQADVFLLDEFACASGFDYLDLSSDQELGEAFVPDSVGQVPFGVSAAAFWAGSLWVAGSPATPTRVFFSSPLFPEQFPGVNYIDVGSSETGRIVALKLTQRGLVVFKERGLYMIRGSHRDGFVLDALDERRGCLSPRAIEYLPGLGLGFLSQEGPCVLQGELADEQPTAVVPLPGIRRTWRRFVGDGRALVFATSVYDPETQEVWWHLPTGNTQVPTLGIVFHLELGQWSLRTGSISCFARHLSRTWVGSWDDTNAPGVHLLTYGSTTLLSSVLSSSYTATFVFDEFKVVRDLTLWAVAEGSAAPLQVLTRGDQRAATPQTTAGKQALLNASTREVWATALWDATGATWADQMLTRLRMSAHQASGRELTVTIAATRGRWMALDLVVAPSAQPRPETP